MSAHKNDISALINMSASQIYGRRIALELDFSLVSAAHNATPASPVPPAADHASGSETSRTRVPEKSALETSNTSVNPALSPRCATHSCQSTSPASTGREADMFLTETER
jgi:hypothetical protein